ncbi:hypothetical protein ASZ90_002149 [hydrocarbon metagenome]|uniref:Uncharacterized protein n=1 Tax=hydrocarbon metagenome TaxID=938273 RepID=A0A0W8G4Q4_9ZZZZ
MASYKYRSIPGARRGCRKGPGRGRGGDPVTKRRRARIPRPAGDMESSCRFFIARCDLCQRVVFLGCVAGRPEPFPSRGGHNDPRKTA